MKFDFFRIKKSLNFLQKSNRRTGKNSTYVDAMFRIFWTKKLHKRSVSMSFSFDWTATARNKPLEKWETLKVKAFATKSSSKLVQNFNWSNDFRRSFAAEQVIAIFAIADISSMPSIFVGTPGFICVLPVTIFWLSIFLSRDNIICFQSTRTFFYRKRLSSAAFNSFSNFSFFASLFWVHCCPSPATYQIRVSGRDQEGCLFQFLSFFQDHPVLALVLLFRHL